MHFFLSFDYPTKRDAVSFREWDAALKPRKSKERSQLGDTAESFLKRLDLNLKPAKK